MNRRNRSVNVNFGTQLLPNYFRTDLKKNVNLSFKTLKTMLAPSNLTGDSWDYIETTFGKKKNGKSLVSEALRLSRTTRTLLLERVIADPPHPHPPML